MHVEVVYLVSLVHEVPAVNVVIKAVVVVIVVVGSLAGVGPDIVFQVGVFNIHASVKDSDNGAFGVVVLVGVPELVNIGGLYSPLVDIIGARLVGGGVVVATGFVAFVIWF